MTKRYYCRLSDSKLCKYGGNKYFNYGFFQGMNGYCRFVNKWIHDLEEKCPLPEEKKIEAQGRKQ